MTKNSIKKHVQELKVKMLVDFMEWAQEEGYFSIPKPYLFENFKEEDLANEFLSNIGHKKIKKPKTTNIIQDINSNTSQIVDLKGGYSIERRVEIRTKFYLINENNMEVHSPYGNDYKTVHFHREYMIKEDKKRNRKNKSGTTLKP